jgi:hypothetical protein
MAASDHGSCGANPGRRFELGLTAISWRARFELQPHKDVIGRDRVTDAGEAGRDDGCISHLNSLR